MTDDHDTLTQRIAAVERSPDYQAADAERAQWWAKFQQAERDGDNAAANAAWLKASQAKRRCQALMDAARNVQP